VSARALAAQNDAAASSQPEHRTGDLSGTRRTVAVLSHPIDADVDWSELAELLIDSYCALAPKKLVESAAGQQCTSEEENQSAAQLGAMRPG